MGGREGWKLDLSAAIAIDPVIRRAVPTTATIFFIDHLNGQFVNPAVDINIETNMNPLCEYYKT